MSPNQILEVLSRQKFADFYNGEFENYLMDGNPDKTEILNRISALFGIEVCGAYTDDDIICGERATHYVSNKETGCHVCESHIDTVRDDIFQYDDAVSIETL